MGRFLAKIYALRKLGEMLRETERAKGTDRAGRKSKLDSTRKLPSNPPLTLSDLGLDKKTSSLSQRLALLSQGQVEAIARRERSVTQVLREKKAAEIRRRR